MARERSLIKQIPKIYKRNFENLGLFFFVEAQKQIIPTITIAQAISNYYKFIDDEYDCEIAQVNFSRMRQEFTDLKYQKFLNETTEKNCGHIKA